MLTVVNPDNTFSGVQYPEIKQEYINHHHQYGQKLIWLERLVNQQLDEQGSPIIETATDTELQNEIKAYISKEEELQADIDYLSIMTGVDLNV
jgi:hypothetical protein